MLISFMALVVAEEVASVKKHQGKLLLEPRVKGWRGGQKGE